MPSEHVSAEALGQQLNLSTEAILRLARLGKIPCIRLSRKIIRFDPEAVKAALSGRQEGLQLRNQAVARVTLSNWTASILLRRVYLGILLKNHPHPTRWDDLRRAQSLPPDVHPNTYGGTMLAMLAEGLAHPVEVVASDRPEAHARRVCTWTCDPKKAKRWLDAYAGLELPEDPQKGLFDGIGGGGA